MENIDTTIIKYVKSCKFKDAYIPVDVRTIHKNVFPTIEIEKISMRVIQLCNSGYLKIYAGQKSIDNPDMLVIYNK